MLSFRIIKILHVLWLSLSRYPIVQTSSGGVQFVEQGQLYNLYPATAGFKACWQLTDQQWVATMGLNFPIFIWFIASMLKSIKYIWDSARQNQQSDSILRLSATKSAKWHVWPAKT